MERFRDIPGVEAADFTNLIPLTPNDDDDPFWIDANQAVLASRMRPEC